MKEKNGRYPSFFKVLVGDIVNKLPVPPDFIKNFNGELPKISTLKSSAERSWGVLMEKTDEGFFFSKGWSKFAIDHRLQFGDFLVFNLTSNSTFEVLIYGHNACEKDTSFLRKQQAATPSTLLPKSLIEKAKHRKMNIEPEIEAVVDSVNPPNNLHFVRTLSNPDMRYNIWVPPDFAKESGLVSKEIVILKDNSEGGGGEMEWPVNVKQMHGYGNVRFRLASGWNKFWVAKGLSFGDSCLFEWVDGSLHVKVLRKVINKNRIELTNLQFVKEMTSQHMIICVPADFARDTGLVSMNSVMLKYINESGDCEDWPVEVQKQNDRHDSVRLGSGWLNFWDAKGLCIGDSYLFEFVDGSIHVKVLRKVVEKKVDLDNLQFLKKMTGPHMKYDISIPADFSRETGLISMNSVTLKYLTESGGSEDWPVKVQNGNDRVRLGSGWLNFWTAKGLCVGDSCLFEFVDGSFHVKVLRKGEKFQTFPKFTMIKKTIELNNLQFVKEISGQRMKYDICMPADFSRETGLVSMNSVTLKDITEGGGCEVWPVKLRKQKDCVILGSGWVNFWTAKGLSVGDSCLFEFVDGSLHVKVFRKAKKSNFKQASV